MADQAPVDKLLHLLPRLHELFVDVGPSVGAAGVDVGAGRVHVGERPVDQVEVKVVGAKVGQRFLASGDDVPSGMLVVPKL